MSKTSRDKYEKPVKAERPKGKTVLCDGCGAAYPESEVSVEVDEKTKSVVARLCGGCV